MAEESQPPKDHHPPIPSPRHQLAQEDNPAARSRPFVPSQPSKEMLHQQRQKCELRRLLKHTHPELKMLDRVVDEELAEVLSTETMTAAAAETGYEGEVLSRRLIFENCALSNKVSPYSRRTHMAEESGERGDVGRTSAVSEQLEERPCAARVEANTEADKTLNPDPSRECEEEIVRIDVQATRRLFESQSVKASRPNPDNKLQGKAAISGDEAGGVQKQKQKQGFEMCSKQNLNSDNMPEKQGWCAVNQSTEQGLYAKEEVFDDEPANPPDPEGETIKTSASLFQNNPFIAKNIDRENVHVHTAKPHVPAADGAAAEDYPADNVKNRAHLFESMPFDKIRSQNKDEIETMVEKIKESLNSLHGYKAIHSHGSIIEVNETVRAKKAKFTLSESGPEIDYDEVAEGNSQNFILHLLPRVNLKPQLTYLKEDRKGNMEATAVNVPVHHHQFATNQDTECKTANVAQLVEDILNQDNSLRKGVIIQEGANRCTDVIVYSLYNYMDEEDVRRYCPGEAKMDRRLGDGETPVLHLQEASSDQPFPGPIRPEVTVKGNVKLFKSCIEKGDLEYLKSLQDEPADEEPPPEQNTELPPAEESPTEWAPVDVKKLKSMFSGDGNPPRPKQSAYKLPAQAATAVPPSTVPCEKSSIESDTERSLRESDVQGGPDTAAWTLEPQPDDGIHQAELVEVVDEADEMVNLQAAIQNLQQATKEAKAFHHSLQEKQKLPRGSSEQPRPNIESQITEVVQKKQHLETASASSNSSEATAAPQEQQQEEEEVVFQGKLQAALDSLEKSNINISRGDFRAAMIFRSSSKAAGVVQKAGEVCPASTPATARQDETAEEATKDEAGGEKTNLAPPKKDRKPSGPKPAVPPKPEHLKMKQDNRSAETHPTNSNSDRGERKEDQIQGPAATMEINNTDKSAMKGEEASLQNIPMSETDESPVDFKEAVKKFGGKKPAKVAPVKPKRVKIAQPEQKNTQSADKQSNIAEPQQSQDNRGTADGKDGEIRQESKVELREKKRRTETEDERRQRLSVHMDEIMRGNIGAAMEIFDNLRKQEELQSILSRVEEIEEDTSEVDVRSLRRAFEDVPDWVVDGNQKRAKKTRVEHKEDKADKAETPTRENTETKSSMAHVFGDLERASEEIMNLKEQTLARLVDIEEAIRKALYSVSTLKSDSDIAGLSSLFKESMGTTQGAPSSGNISKISIGSSRTKTAPEQEVPSTQGGAVTPSRQRASPPSSPAFISIQSAARKAEKAEKAEPAPQESCPTCQLSPRAEETFRSTKTLQCNSPAQSRRQDPRGGGPKQPARSPANQKRELAVLEVQTDRQGAASVLGTKTVTENYERTDDSGSRFYSSKTSTVVTTQPETMAPPTGHMVISSPPTYQVTTYPEVRLPVNHKP